MAPTPTEIAKAAFPVAILNMRTALESEHLPKSILKDYLEKCNDLYSEEIRLRPDSDPHVLFFNVMTEVLRNHTASFLFKHKYQPAPKPYVVRVVQVETIINDERHSLFDRDALIIDELISITMTEEYPDVAKKLGDKNSGIWNHAKSGHDVGNRFGISFVTPAEQLFPARGRINSEETLDANEVKSMLGLSHLHQGQYLVLLQYPGGVMHTVTSSTPSFIEAIDNPHFRQRVAPACPENWGRTVNLDKLYDGNDEITGCREALIDAVPFSTEFEFCDLGYLDQPFVPYNQEQLLSHLHPNPDIVDAVSVLNKCQDRPNSFLNTLVDNL